MTTLRNWAHALHGRVAAGLVRCPGPGHSPSDNSLVVTPAPGSRDGFIVYSHAGDDWKVCRDHIRQLLNLPGFAAGPGGQAPAVDFVAVPATTAAARDGGRDADQIWQASLPLLGSPAYRYLEQRLKGRAVPQAVVEGGALRWNPNVRVPGAIGAMIGLMTDPISGRPLGIHRTYINGRLGNVRGPDGKSIRRMLGSKGVVRLWADEEVSITIAIGEGIETAIAGAIEGRATPVWAVLDAGNMQNFPVLHAIEGLTIFVDHDQSGVGPRAAERCAARWYACARITARLLIPTVPGDFNDILKGVPA